MTIIDSVKGRIDVVPGDLSGKIRPQNLEQAAVQFEAVFLRSMLQQMRKTVDVFSDDDSVFNSKQQRMMRDFYDDQLAQTLASQRSSGVADLLIQQLGNAAADMADTTSTSEGEIDEELLHAVAEEETETASDENSDGMFDLF